MDDTNDYVQPLVRADARLRALVRKYGLRRSLAAFLYYSLATRLPNPGMPGGGVGHLLRLFLARRMLKRCGSGVRIASGARFGSGAQLEIGNNSRLSRGSWMFGEIVIGNNVLMAPEVTILASNHTFDSYDQPILTQGQQASEAVVIGDDVWIGTRAIILPGVKVGNHAIIGAGAVVTRSVGDWAIVAGNPAQLIRDRRVPKEQDENQQ